MKVENCKIEFENWNLRNAKFRIYWKLQIENWQSKIENWLRIENWKLKSENWKLNSLIDSLIENLDHNLQACGGHGPEGGRREEGKRGGGRSGGASAEASATASCNNEMHSNQIDKLTHIFLCVTLGSRLRECALAHHPPLVGRNQQHGRRSHGRTSHGRRSDGGTAPWCRGAVMLWCRKGEASPSVQPC